MVSFFFFVGIFKKLHAQPRGILLYITRVKIARRYVNRYNIGCMKVEGLRGKRIMVVESAELVNPVISQMYHELGHSVGIRQFEIPPEDIDKYIEKIYLMAQ